MGRISQIPEIEAKLGGVNLKTWLTDRIKEGKTPDEIAKLMGAGKSQTYAWINEFGLKDTMKAARKAITTGIQGELRGIFTDYLHYLQIGNRSPKTISNLENTYKNFFWWLEENKRPCTLANFTESTISDFQYYCKTVTPRFGGKTAGSRRPLTPGAQNTYRTQFSMFGSWLEQKQLIERGKNPVKWIPKAKEGKRKIEDLPDETVKEIINSFDESSFNGLRNKTVILTFLMTGMRLAGVENIRRDTFDLKTGVGKTVEKGDKERDILLTPYLKDQFQKYATERDKVAGDSEWLWVTSDGKRFTRGGIKEMVQSLKRFDKKVHPHMFRHLFAKAMYENKVPMQNIMTYGGWASLEMVMRYAKDYQSKVHWEAMKEYTPFDRWNTGDTRQTGKVGADGA